MKVKIEFTIDIDTDAWTINYGVEGADAIRRDVQSYIHSLALDHMGSEGVDVLTPRLPDTLGSILADYLKSSDPDKG